MSSDAVGGAAGADGVSERFRAAVASSETADAELLPTRLCEVASAVLGCDAAGLSLFTDDLRVPLGASDQDAARLERMQFTTEQGPCWQAVHDHAALAADAAEIARRWPHFAAEVQRSRFGSVASVPVRLARGVGGALDLYFAEPSAAGAFDLADAVVVAAHVAELLDRSAGPAGPPDVTRVAGPAWARGPAARARLAVWVAVDMVIQEADTSAVDALALLRAVAFTAEASVDDIAADLLDGRVTVAELLPA